MAHSGESFGDEDLHGELNVLEEVNESAADETESLQASFVDEEDRVVEEEA